MSYKDFSSIRILRNLLWNLVYGQCHKQKFLDMEKLPQNDEKTLFNKHKYRV
jgi:hypothetical protein